MITDLEQDRLHLIEHRIVTEYGRDKVAKAVYEVLLEGLRFGPGDLPTAEDRDWLRGAMAVPIQEATDAALEVLAWAMVRTLERSPGDLLGRYERSHLPEETGWE